MKTSIKNLFLVPGLIAGLGSLPAARVTAQALTNLHSFTAYSIDGSSNGDGAFPLAGLILSGNTLYGSANRGGLTYYGTVFAVNTDGTGFTNLHNFTAASGSLHSNSDGANPYDGFVLSGNTLYGTASGGGSSGNGTVFRVNTDGTGFTNLHSFTATAGPSFPNSDGANPAAGLVLSGTILYGTAYYGGSSGNGTVFAVNTDGTGFTNLHSFTAYTNGTNSDGANPGGVRLILSGNTLYGTASHGGASANGAVFAINTDGTGFTNLYSFTGIQYSPNNDGGHPNAVVLSGNMLYGTANDGGTSANGTVFAINIDGTGFTNLHSFTAISGSLFTNTDGSHPKAVILSGTTLYGTAGQGGAWAKGTVFAINTDGTGFTNLYSFTATSGSLSTNSDGAGPNGGLILTNNTLYGTASGGGLSGNGTVFSLSLPAPPNQRPTFDNPIPDQTNSYGGSFNYSFPTNTFADPDDGQLLTYTASDLPPGIVFDGPSRTFSGTNTSVGNYTVTVTATDNGSPPLATNTTFQFVVNKALLLVKALDETNTYGNVSLDYYLGVTYSGFVLGEDYYHLDYFGLPYIQTSATNGSPVGTYPITFSGGVDAHYEYVFQDGTLTITPAALRVEAANACRGFGQPNPSLLGILTGVLYFDTITASFTTTAGIASPAGNYQITPLLNDPRGQLGNYVVTSVNGTLTIESALLRPRLEVLHSFGFANRIGAASGELLEGADGWLYGCVGAFEGAGFGVFRINKDGSGFVVVRNFSAVEGQTLGSLLQETDGTLYGMSQNTVWRMQPNGTGFDVLHSFGSIPNDGTNGVGSLLKGSDGMLYGTTRQGGEFGYGTVFTLSEDGSSSYAVLHSFGAPFSDGADPSALVEGQDGALYGTTLDGGLYNSYAWGGTVFRLTKAKDGLTFSVLHRFANGAADGAYPRSRLLTGGDGKLYGTAANGGPSFGGTIFSISEDGLSYALLKTFDYYGVDGRAPYAPLIKGNDGMLYGTTTEGGPTSYGGTAFRISTDGIVFKVLKQFADTASDVYNPIFGLLNASDGMLYGTASQGGDLVYNPVDGGVFRLNPQNFDYSLVYPFSLSGGDGRGSVTRLYEASDGLVYGTTTYGGAADGGTVFRAEKTGANYLLLHNFTGATNDGLWPAGGVTEGPDGALYGTTQMGGTVNAGTVFRLERDGSSFALLHSFGGSPDDGSSPKGGLLAASDGMLYGTTAQGGTNFGGTAYSIATNGIAYVVLHSFDAGTNNSPECTLIEDADGYLYGTTSGGYNYVDEGSVFRIRTDGSDFSVLRAFDGSAGDSGQPLGGLLLASDGALYGTTSDRYNYGTRFGSVFKLNPNGTNFQTLHTFGLSATDGQTPMGPPVEAQDGRLFGTTSAGGVFAPLNFSGAGTIFHLQKDSSDYCVLFHFDNNTPNLLPTNGKGPLMRGSDGSLYALTADGGDLLFGTLYRLNFSANNPPFVQNSIPDQTNVYGAAFSYSFPADTFNDGDASQSLTYTASNLPPGISFDGPARTFSGTNTSVGTYSVTVTATDNGSPALSTNTTFTISVAKALLAARSLDHTNFYGDFIFVNSYLDVDYSGFKFADNFFSLQTPPAISTTATSTSSIANYPIHLSGGSDSHYDFSLQDGLYTLVPAPLTVIVYNACRLAGQANPPLSGRFLDLRNNDPITPSFSTTATTTSPPGSYPISVTFADPNLRLPNYSLTYLPAELTILPYDFLFDIIHPFGTNSDDVASNPNAAVTEVNGELYGLTEHGGALGRGAAFGVQKDGTGYRLITSFPTLYTLDDSLGHPGSLVLGTNGLLFGVAPGNSTFIPGAIFSLDTNGVNLTLLHQFTLAEGITPNGPLLLSTNGVLYGTAQNGNDLIYRIAQDGTGFTNLWQNSVYGTGPYQLAAGLIEGRNGFLYGTSVGGGDYTAGTVFKIQKDGNGLTVLHSFSDGGEPLGLIEGSDGWLYGTAADGGLFSQGSVYKLATDGTGFAVLHHFDRASGDGEAPIGTILEGNDGYLYGTTERGGSSTGVWGGIIYRLKKDGSGYCILHNFGGPLSEPGYLTSALFEASDGAFYGTAKFGVTDSKGAVFRLTPLVPPTLSIVEGSGTATVSWAPATPGFVLQQNPSLNPLAWTEAPSGSTNPVSLPIGVSNRFFRLHNP